MGGATQLQDGEVPTRDGASKASEPARKLDIGLGGGNSRLEQMMSIGGGKGDNFWNELKEISKSNQRPMTGVQMGGSGGLMKGSSTAHGQ